MTAEVRPFAPDEYTVALYHFDEGEGNAAHDAGGDPELTLQAKEALWGSRPGSGAAARFSRRADDANVFVGPTNNDKLHLRGCAAEWTIEAWVRYTGSGGKEKGHTYANICGTEDEGFGLPIGMRGGWNFSLHDMKKERRQGLVPAARFMGFPRDRDPNHDTSSILMPGSSAGGWTDAVPSSITDSEWHHVVWQFRYLDQTHFFFLDGQLIRQVKLPLPGNLQGRVINDTRDVGVPFVVGGFIHSQDPPFHLEHGSFEGRIAEIRISNTMRYPVAERLTIVRRELPAAGLQVPYSAQLSVDGEESAVEWELAGGRLPIGVHIDKTTGIIHGAPVAEALEYSLTVGARGENGQLDQSSFILSVRPGRVITESLPPAFAGSRYRAAVTAEHMATPVRWKVVTGSLPEGLRLDPDTGEFGGSAEIPCTATLGVEATDANGMSYQVDLRLRVLPAPLRTIAPDEHTVALYTWEGADGRLIRDVMGDEDLTLTWTNMGGDRRVSWPGREGRFPQDTGHGEHGFVGPQRSDKLDLRECKKEWTVEAWVRRGGPFHAHGKEVGEHTQPFDYGHICGTYDTTERGVWELYLSDHDSPDGSMAPGAHFLGAEPEQALINLHPWKRPEGIVGDPALAGIRDVEWHHVAWQYAYAEDVHQLFLDGALIWQMASPDGRKLVNNRHHDAQFSVITRLNGYTRYGGGFNYLGWGNFYGQIGEIRISKVRRYR